MTPQHKRFLEGAIGLTGLFWIVALSQAIFGGINAIGFATGRSWGRAPPSRGLEPVTSLEKA